MLTAAAQITRSVNTIVNDGGVLTGHCTDGKGFTANLASGGFGVKDKKITILGGGGVSSAVAAQCVLEGAEELSIFNRKDKFWDRLERYAETLRSEAPSCSVNIYDLDDEEALRSRIDSSHLLVNANCVGMAPLENESLIKDSSVFREDLTVADVVYSPAGDEASPGGEGVRLPDFQRSGHAAPSGRRSVSALHRTRDAAGGDPPASLHMIN